MRKQFASLTKRIVKLRSAPMLVRRRGAYFVLDPQNWIDNRLIAGAPYEDRQIDNAEALIAAENLDTFVDVGANFGLYTVLLGRNPRITSVVAFEPVRRNYAQLMGNVFANGLEATVEAHRVGAWSQAGEATIHVDPTSTGVSRLDLETTARRADVFRAQETIRLAALDDILTMAGRRVFLKMDIEGAAHRGLAGMKRFLAENHVVAQIELSPAEDAPARALLGQLGYREIARIEADCIFARRADTHAEAG